MFIVIEKFGEPIVVTNVDGEVSYFDTPEEAVETLNDCQDGMLVSLDDDESKTIEIPLFIKNINWKLLREQKEVLVNIVYSDLLITTMSNQLEGIVHLIDALQDYAVDYMRLSDKDVFNLENE